MHQHIVLALVCIVQAPPAATARLEHAVVVNEENPNQSISETELRRMLKAEVHFWPRSYTVVELLLPRSGTPARAFLNQYVYEMTDLQLKRYWLGLIYQNRIVEAPRSVPSLKVAVPILERLRGSITVFPARDVTPGAKVKLLAVDGRHPNEPDYPLWEAEAPQATPQVQARVERGGVSEASAGTREAYPLEPDETWLDEAAQGAPTTLQEWDRESWPPIHLRTFAHGEYEWERVGGGTSDETNSGFSIEVIDFLLTSALTKRASVLAETTIEAQDAGGFVVEVERLLIKYQHSDAFSLEAGRFLTGIGYWNTRYNHGEWLQTSIDRPEVLDFEDDTGLLPVHNVGLSFKGRFYAESITADYTLEIANGRAPTPDETQAKLDANEGKALNAAIGLEPAFLPGLRFGGGVYLDRIPENTDATLGNVHGSIDEQITSVYCAFNDTDWEIMGEYFWLDHEETGTTSRSDGWYGQIGRHFGSWTPYVRIDAVNRDDQNQYFQSSDDGFTEAIGLRYDVGKHMALTLQYEHAEIDAPAAQADYHTDTVVLQASLVF